MLQPVEHGYIYYVSRDDPEETREFFYEYDPEFMRKGREQLKVWRKFFEAGLLPQTHLKGKHPFGWNWTTDDSPCKWCPFGPTGVVRVQGGPPDGCQAWRTAADGRLAGGRGSTRGPGGV